MKAETALSPAVSREKLVADLKLLVADTDELLRATASQLGDKVAPLRERIQASAASAKSRLVDLERAGVEKSRETVKVADNYIHENPWASVGIAAAGALVVGVLIGRR
jgi:ElaB/YqjD/DUF883 family membrane-anchored ribosome-binding protein